MVPAMTQVNGTASEVDFQIRRLKLDELELASLRGEVEEAGLKLDLEARQGRGQVIVQGPRFSGLQGELLSTAVRWDQDVVRLERANLQQKNSRYSILSFWFESLSQTVRPFEGLFPGFQPFLGSDA